MIDGFLGTLHHLLTSPGCDISVSSMHGQEGEQCGHLHMLPAPAPKSCMHVLMFNGHSRSVQHGEQLEQMGGAEPELGQILAWDLQISNSERDSLLFLNLCPSSITGA